ILVR
ncbi:Glycosyl transferase family 2, partial [Haemophilus influenzae]